jgi:hypothetical protein
MVDLLNAAFPQDLKEELDSKKFVHIWENKMASVTDSLSEILVELTALIAALFLVVAYLSSPMNTSFALGNVRLLQLSAFFFF